MMEWIKTAQKVCWINGLCQGEFLLWDMATPWDGPTEWN